MLTTLDDSVFHQLPTTFDHVGTSDPRFFDRVWFAAYEPDGFAALQFTLGVYSNMNVADGGMALVHEGVQYNLRVSRSLRPRFETVCGPLRFEVVQPLDRFRLRVEAGNAAVHGELEWASILPPEEEKPHFQRVRGRVAQDYQRFNQLGTVSGWLSLQGHRLDVRDWWGCRDHSWGVRPDVGGSDPVTGHTPPPSQLGALFAFLFFSTNTAAGHIQLFEHGRERVYLTGLVRDRREPQPADRQVVAADLTLELHEGTRRMRMATFTLRLDDERALTVRTDALGPSIVMPGLGYSGGWNDGLGLGVWRGDIYQEVERWDVRHPVDVARQDGTVTQPVHRIQPVRVAAVGSGFDGSGTGSLTMIALGKLPQYGLEG